MNRHLIMVVVLPSFIALILLGMNSCKKDTTEEPAAPTVNNGELASLTTLTIGSITTSSAEGGGSVTSNGGTTITSRGVCWSTSTSPTVSDNKSTDGGGNGYFNSNLTGLAPTTTYYVKAYAVNSAGTAYGNQVVFTTF